MKIGDVLNVLEEWAPTQYQENYDNAGLITGQRSMAFEGAIITLDCIEAVVDEAIEKGANLIIAHHPIIFRGLKKINGNNYVERTIIKAIKADIGIYAIHTNLDNVLSGVNAQIAKRLNLQKTSVLSPKTQTLSKLVAFVPRPDAQKVLDALYQAGAGGIGNYDHCSFQLDGTGTFRPNDEANPHIGKLGVDEQVAETRIEVILPSHGENSIVAALKKFPFLNVIINWLTCISFNPF